MRPTIYFAPPAANTVILQQATSGPEAVFEVLRPIDLRASKGVAIELAHLEAMAKSYDPKVEAAALNFDHALGGPAHGFAKEIWMQGGRLWARFHQLSVEAIEAVKSGRWPRRSAEIILNHPVLRGPYFQGLALLGNSLPAVPGLAPATIRMSRQVNVIQLSDEPGPPDTRTPEVRAYHLAAGLSDKRVAELALKYPTT